MPGLVESDGIDGGVLSMFNVTMEAAEFPARLIRHHSGDCLFILVAPCFHQTTMLPWKKALRY